MKVTVLGTGTVGRTLAAAWESAGHALTIGTRDVGVTMGRTDRGQGAAPSMAEWREEHPGVGLIAFSEVGDDVEVVVNATSGSGSLEALSAVGADRLAGRVLVDVANPLDFSQGMPPVLAVANTTSLAEQIQQAFPTAAVVKTLNTVTAAVMARPARLAGAHTMFVAGDSDPAKTTVRGLLGDLGWSESSVLDLGGLRSARGMEMYLPLWLSLWGALGTADVNVHVVY